MNRVNPARTVCRGARGRPSGRQQLEEEDGGGKSVMAKRRKSEEKTLPEHQHCRIKPNGG